MPKPKLLKYPKTPKASASLAVVENFMRRCREVDAINRKKVADEKKRQNLLKKAKTVKSKPVKY